MKKIRIFLGGTCANTTWREKLIPYLEKMGFEYFNPVVEDWTPECQLIEEDEKNNKCNVHLYVITKEMQGTYSIAEIIHSAYLANMYGTSVDKVVFFVLDENTWKPHEKKSFDAIMKLVINIARENAIVGWVSDMIDLSNRLNACYA